MIRQEFPVLELGWVPLISLPPPELRGLSRFEISKYRNALKNIIQEKKENKQIKIIDRITDKALKQVELERKNKSRNYIVEWFRYAELVSKGLNKYLN